MTVPFEEQTNRQLLITIVRGQERLLTNQQITLSLLGEIDRKATTIMSDQSHLDADVATLQTSIDSLTATNSATAAAVTVIAAEIAALKAANPAIDFTKADQAVADAQAAAAGAATQEQAVAGLEPPAPPA